MDDSFMSIGSFDEENFISEAFQDEADSSQNAPSSTVDIPSTSSIDINSLLNQPFKEPEPKTQLVFSSEQATPKNSARGHLKRKNIARRCLSTDFNDSSSSLSFEV